MGADGELAGGGTGAALIEIAKIANYRFDDRVADANPIASARVTRFAQLDR